MERYDWQRRPIGPPEPDEPWVKRVRYNATGHAQHQYLIRISQTVIVGEREVRFDMQDYEGWHHTYVIARLGELYGPDAMRELRFKILPPDLWQRTATLVPLDNKPYECDVYDRHSIVLRGRSVLTVKHCYLRHDNTHIQLAPPGWERGSQWQKHSQ
jgi:hypothetical protein